MSADPEKAVVEASKSQDEDTEEIGEEEETGPSDEDIQLTNLWHPDVVRRIKALKNNQLEIIKLETKFFQEMHALECKYMPLYKPLFEKREQVVNGKYEPNDQECDFKQPDPDPEITEAMNKMNINADNKDPIVGVPGFWAHIFRNVELLFDLTQEHDYPILRHLIDIRVEMSDQPMGFNLHFHFSPNEYFTNTVLMKSYEMKCELDPEDPFSFEGPEIIRCKGCPIEWNKGKNVTIKIVRKKQKHKQRGNIRTICKTIDVPSFFQFFSPPDVPENTEAELDEETQMRLTNDFEVGQYIRERIVPRAVLYYTGEALEDEEEDDEFEEEEEEEEAEDEEEEEAAPKKKNRARKVPGGPAGAAQREECKQQ